MSAALCEGLNGSGEARFSPMTVHLSFTATERLSPLVSCVCVCVYIFVVSVFCSPLPHRAQPRQRNSLPQPGYRKEDAGGEQAPVVCPGQSGLSLLQPITRERERHCQVWKERSGAAAAVKWNLCFSFVFQFQIYSFSNPYSHPHSFFHANINLASKIGQCYISVLIRRRINIY